MTFWDNPACIAAGNCTVGGSGGLYPARSADSWSAEGNLAEWWQRFDSAADPWSSLGLYFQDDWKVSPTLTLNLGLRWDANADFLQPQLGDSLTTSNKGIWDLRQVMMNPNFPTSDPGAQTIEQLVGNTGNLTAHDCFLEGVPATHRICLGRHRHWQTSAAWRIRYRSRSDLPEPHVVVDPTVAAHHLPGGIRPGRLQCTQRRPDRRARIPVRDRLIFAASGLA